MNPFDEALLEGEKWKAKESARNLLKLKKITDEEISDAVGLSMDELNIIKNEEKNKWKMYLMKSQKKTQKKVQEIF